MDHNEPAFVVASHPHLGMYFTGSTRGRLHAWGFNLEQNQALDQFVTDSNWKDNSNESWNINKIKLNHYGDKIVCTDNEGNLYMFSLASAEGTNTPDITLKKATYSEMLDFEFLNQGSVFCTTGFRPNPHVTIYDTLLPPSSCAVMREEIGGNIILALHDLQQLLIFNSKTPGLKIFDIRMKKLFDQFVNHSSFKN